MLLLLTDEVFRPVNILFFSTIIILAQQLFEMFDEVQNVGWYDVIMHFFTCTLHSFIKERENSCLIVRAI